MADFIPDRLPSRASRGEERTFALLKNLPDDYLVYYEPNVDGRHPDFIVIAPDLGVIVIEVKGWYLDDILRASDSEVVVNFEGSEKKEVHPLAQARAYQWRLARICDKNPKRQQLIHADGKYQGKFIFPFCHFVVLSNISRDNIDRKNEQNLYTIFRPENTLFRDELVALEDATPEMLRRTLLRFFDPYWEIVPFTPEQVDVLRSIIHPEIILSYVPIRQLTEEETDQCFDLVVLDRRQENNARRIGEGHRIIYGVAGSGKTVLLISRAKWLNDRDPHAKILLLCYNVSLSAYLKMLLKEYSRIHVFHFDGWTKHNNITRSRKDARTGAIESDESLGKRLLEHLKRHAGDFRQYDAILIDEAQDFPSIWFSCILEAMRDPFDGDLLIVCDGNQGVRLIGAVSWKSLGIKAAGRTIHQVFDLDRNYRNTREILRLARIFTAKNVKNSEDSISIVPVDPGQAIRHGPRPILYACKDHADECSRVIHLVKRFLGGSIKFRNKPVKVHPHEIGILYHELPKKAKPVFTRFIEELRTIAPVTWLNQNRTYRSRVAEQSLKIQTVHSAKGLQYRVVIVMWADQFRTHRDSDSDHEERLLYVALTRASDVLIVTYSEYNDLVDRMVKSSDTDKLGIRLESLTTGGGTG